MFTIAAAVNDVDILRGNLYRSPGIFDYANQIIVKENCASASLAYNAAIDEAQNDLMIFVHQDVYLPEDWFSNLARSLRYLRERRIEWGVLGCFGVNRTAPDGVGRIYSTGWGRIGTSIANPERVDTLDEIVLVIRKSSGLRFDEALPHFHLYGADICLSARDKGKANYAFQGYCVHNTNQLLRLPEEFYQCYHYLKAKWRKFLPIYTSCIKVSRLNGDLYSRRLHEIGETALGKSKRPMLRVGDPRPFASEVPAELTEQL